MSIQDLLEMARSQLEKAGIPTARLDALVLLEDCLRTDRAQLLAHPERQLTTEQENVLNQHVKTRAAHEPLAYIRGKTEFYGREFMIDHRVLEPRPESETIIDLLKKLSLPEQPQIADIGTGSGMLAITAKLELPKAKVIATDIDRNCLDVAKQNAANHKTDITFIKGDLLGPIKSTPDVLLCNLPYVPDSFQINPAAMREPHQAIFGGPDGLSLYRKLFTQIDKLKQKPKYVFTESLPPQHHVLAEIARKHSYALEIKDDFIQVFTPEKV